jgi:acyl-CoA synthetase (AMP-forming)/AMP-acid ligase II
VIDLIDNRARERRNDTCLIADGRVLTFGDLAAEIGFAAAEIERVVPLKGSLLLPEAPIDRIIGLFAAMAASRVVLLGSGRLGDDRMWSHQYVDGSVISTGTYAPRWVETIDGFAVVVSTSGTAGTPKLVVHDDRSLAANLVLTTSVEDELHGGEGLDPTDPLSSLEALGCRHPRGLRFLSGMPLTSIAGISMLMRAIALGELFVVAESLDARHMWSAAVEHQVTNVGLPPITATRFADCATGTSGLRPPLLHLGVGGAFADPTLVARLERNLGCLVTVGYGATELGGVAIMSRPWDPPEERYATVGRPLRGVEIYLRRTSERGTELFVRSPSIARGVIENGKFRHLPRWFHTGDLASRTASGAITIGGRSDHMITRAGHRIDPARIEAMVERHNLVDRAGVHGAESRIPGNMDIIAFVSLANHRGKPISQGDLVKEIRQHCIRHLPVHEIPRAIYIVSEIPLAGDLSPSRGTLEEWTVNRQIHTPE